MSLASLLLLGGALAGCDRSEPAGKVEAKTAPKGSVTPTPTEESSVAPTPASDEPGASKQAEDEKAPDRAEPPEGWTRVELSSVVPGLTGTIDVPPGVTAEAAPRQDLDADFLESEARGVRIGPRSSGLTLEAPAVVPPRMASAEAMAAFHDRFEKVSTHELGPDHWAVVQKWRPGECMMHGWSAAAGLTCDVFKASCDEMEQWVRVCGTLTAGPKPNTSPTTPKSAFPGLETGAAEVAIAVARAVARDDESLLLGVIGPEGVKIGKKTHTKESLATAFEGASVLQVVAPIFHEMGHPLEALLSWNAGESSESKATIWFSSAYGEQPYFELAKTGEAWHLVAFGVEDLGEP